MPAWQSNMSTRRDTMLLVLVAGTVWTFVRIEFSWSPAPMALRASGELMATLGLSFLLRRQAISLPQARGLAGLAVCTAATYPFVAEYVIRCFSGGSEPFELLLLTSLQLVTAALAVFCHVPRLGSSAVLLSSFLLLFVTTMTHSRIALTLIGIYAALVLWWLMGVYWDRLAGTFVAATVERKIPMRVAVIGGTAFLLVVPVGVIGTSGAAVALPGFLPTSGGTRWHDLNARLGVGDGDAIIAAQGEANSFGPVESEIFLDSDMPTLYDMLNDVYGEPPERKKRKQERTIAMSPDSVKETEQQQTAESQRSGREFSAVRRKAQRKQLQLDDRKSPAMLYVIGRVPVHLALERFDTFDGREWTQSGDRTHPPIWIEHEQGKPWAYFDLKGASPIDCGVERHALKVINLKSNRFPSPPRLSAIHVDKVDQADFFGWTDDGVAHMPVRDHIPQLTVLRLQSQNMNLTPLRESSARDELFQYRFQGEGGLEESTVADWTRNVPQGWEQVEAVVSKLRSEFTLDPESPVPEECENVVECFLQTKRGPDYLFATAAAALLRHRGFETRLVTGFYAREERFDYRAGQTSVLADDVHVWAEVRVGDTTWVPIEPTPGYTPPLESLTWRQHAAKVLANCLAWVASHAMRLLGLITLMALLWQFRRVWLDAAAVVVCHCMGFRSRRDRLLWTIRLLEWRAWLTGRSRPRQSTIVAWYQPLFRAAPADLQPTLSQFLLLTDRLLYAPAGIDVVDRTQIDSACQAVLSVCTRKQIATNHLRAAEGNR